MESCDIYAEHAAAGFSSIRQYGTGTIVATNLPVGRFSACIHFEGRANDRAQLQVVKIGSSTVHAISPVFNYHISYDVERDEGGRPQLRQSAKTTPVTIQVPYLSTVSISASG